MLKKIHGDQRGVAMVLALSITFVVMLLSIFVVRLAIHNVDQSSFDRRRLLSVSAAEAGVKDYYAYLSALLRGGEQNSLDTVKCSLQAGVSTGPNDALYDATITFYNAAGVATACPPPSGSVPAAVRIRSTGQAPSGALRTMESYSQLVPVYGGTTAAVMSNGNTTLSNKMTLNGYNGSDADLYVNGNFVVNNNQTFNGNVYVQGSVDISNGAFIDGILWARDGLTMSQGTVNGDAYSTTSSISISNPALIMGNAKARTTISSTSQVKGTSSPNTTTLSNPPSQSFPALPYNITKWQNAGYQLANGAAFTSCATAKSWLTNPANLPSSPVAGVNYNYVVRIQPSAACNLSFGSGDTVYLPGNVAILTDCGITMTNHPIFQSVGGNHSLFLVSVSGASVCSGAQKAISTSNQVEFNNLVSPNRLDVFIYSPSTVTMANQNAINGQVYGQPVTVSNQTTLNYIPVFVPGLTTVNGFRQNVQYLREVPA